LAIISMLFSTACSINLGGQARDGYQAQGSNRVRNQSIPLETTTANHGKRCEDREYLYEAPDEPEADSIRYGECYRLQKQLVSAALEGDVATMADALKHGASPEGTYYASFPPLHTAARFGHAEAVRLLLDNGADVNRVSGVDSTALGAAATGGHVEVIRILIEYGADVNYRNYGGTAEDNARRSGHTQAADLLSEARRCSVPTPE
jgi:ankyrin repeat protein